VIVVDTGGVIALLDRDDRHHEAVRRSFEKDAELWVLPWAILPEVDYLASRRLSAEVALAFAQDVQAGIFRVDAQAELDLPRAVQLLERFADLKLGLVDAVVMAQAERHRATAIITTDLRHFRAVPLALKKAPRLIPHES
jgi:uncharacterized protein